MISPHEHPWNPLTPAEVIPLFAGWDRFWCIAGGWSIDLNTRQVSREHEDVDVLVLRRDLATLHARLPGWELFVAWPPGRLSPWLAGETIHDKAHDVWAREAGGSAWRFQLMVMDHNEESWIFRRDWSIGGPLESLAHDVDGVPLLAPEIQLLYKGNGTRRPKDEADFRTALPHLATEQRAWLRDALASRESDHPWLPMLTTSAP
jgi:hypothetical protein